MGTPLLHQAVSLLVAISVLVAPQRRDLAPGIAMLVDRIQERHGDASDLRAVFVQRSLSRLGSVMNEARGRMYIQAPGKMRWEYETDNQLMVFGGPGREAYLYYPDENQVQVRQADVSTTSEMPIFYLSGRGNLRRDFNITPVEWGPRLASGNVQLELTPRRAGTSFEWLILEVEPLQATIVRLVTRDNLRNTIDYQFHDVEFDVGLPDSLFEFEIPEGAAVMFIGS